MSTDPNLDEQAIRAQMDAALAKTDLSKLEPEMETGGGGERDRQAGGRRRRGPGAPHGGADHGSDAHLAKGTVTSIDGLRVYVELGPRSHGVISLEEFEEPPQPGQEFEFSLVSISDNMWTLSRKEARTLATWKELQRGRIVKATVIGENSGGLELKVGPVSAFMPASEIDTAHVESFTPLVGQTFISEVLEVDPRRKRVVLSRKTVMLRERREQRGRTLEQIAVGQVVKGKVEKVEPFGAFVDIGGGLTGLLHVSNISHQRVEDASKALAVGQPVEVQILEIKNGGNRIGLGMKQLQADPWESVKARLKVGQSIQGKVTRLTEFGAFVEVEPGIEGLLHRSQLSPERVVKISDAVKPGETVNVRIVGIEDKGKRISLSRLTARGHLIGSDDDIGSEELGKFLDTGKGGSTGTNLGALLREALEKKAKGG